MASDHGSAAVHGDMDLEPHEATYHRFIELTKTCAVVILSIVMLLILWGLEGQALLALFGLILTFAAAAAGILIGQGWKLVAPVFVLLAVACILF